jgi:flagellar biosynthesis component FlhA
MVSVATFFMEVTILGECIEKLSFLKTLTKYLKHWHRAVFYMGISITPIVLWCLSTSTIIPMVLLFLIGALNFTLAMGQKGDHSEQVAARWKRLNDNDDNEEEEEEEEEEKEENINNEIPA